ncbi:MAG: bifunctional 2-polyprenyl-6-hydroxyphenol methylase/3-demethylubiquinol 3-O-methyltransferase UbiG, partial [Alteromonas oceani]
MTETQQNVDQTEIDKFSEIAAHWWDPQGQFKPLHAINPLRLSFIEEKCAGVFGKKILDVGCGGGILAESLAMRGAEVTGIDMASASLEIAQ